MEKKIRLLKDLPGVKAGAEFNLQFYPEAESELINISWLGDRKPIDNALNRTIHFYFNDKEWFEEIKEEAIWASDGQWVGGNPNVEHYFIEADLTINNHNYSANIGICFNTKENAEIYLAKQEAIKIIKRWKAKNDNNWIPDWSGAKQYKYYIYYYNSYGYFEVGCTNGLRDREDFYYFSSREIAEKAIKELEKEFRIVLDIKN